MRDLNKLFNPSSVAIIGASSKEKSVGLGLVNNILYGKDNRKIFLVNPNQGEIEGMETFSKVGDIKDDVDLAVIAVPAKFVEQVVQECCQKKVGSIVIISSGFSEIGKEGQIRQQTITEIARKAGVPMVGPNCLGIIKTANKLNASFAPAMPEKGNIAFVSQSGALIDVIIDGLENLGLSHAISFGNEADVDLVDFLEYLENDQDTKVIALYLEAVKNGKRFLEVASRISAKKPIVAIKAGKFENGKDVVKSHTGSMAGDYQIYRAAFKQSGIIEVETIEEMIDISKILSWQSACQGRCAFINSFAIVTNGGGCGVMASDYCKEFGINLARLSKESIDAISNSQFINPAWSKANPVDIIGDASSLRYKVAIEAVLSQKDVAGLIVIQTPQIMTEALENAKIIVEAQKKYFGKPIICFFLGGRISKEAIEFLEKNLIPNYDELKRGIKAIKCLLFN